MRMNCLIGGELELIKRIIQMEAYAKDLVECFAVKEHMLPL